MTPLNLAGPRVGPEHDVLLLAGDRPEAARLAPVAAAMSKAGRIEPVAVATGADPMRVHLALEMLGVPAEVTLLLGAPPASQVAAAAAMSLRLDELMAQRCPSAVLVTGGGLAAVVGAQVAFWREIPVVYLEPAATQLGSSQRCPFPDGANRRVVGQLTSLFLLAGPPAGGCAPDGPHAITVGDTIAPAALADPSLGELATRVGAGRSRVALLDAETPVVLDAVGDLLAGHADLEVVLVGPSVPAELRGHPRVSVLADPDLPDVLAVARLATLAATDHPAGYREALDLGLPALLVDRSGADKPPPGAVPADRDRVLAEMTRLLAARPAGAASPVDPDAPRRVEHALAWMFGLEASADPSSAVPPGARRDNAADSGEDASAAPLAED